MYPHFRNNDLRSWLRGDPLVCRYQRACLFLNYQDHLLVLAVNIVVHSL